MNKKTRFKIAIAITIFMMLICAFALKMGAEGVAERCIIGLMIIGPAYIAGDSYRKSDKPT